jgi:hypothetical protein
MKVNAYIRQEMAHAVSLASTPEKRRSWDDIDHQNISNLGPLWTLQIHQEIKGASILARSV